VRLVSIGMAEEAGALVPISAGDPAPYLYQGAPVQSRLVAASLQAVASAGEGGAYIRAGNDAIDAAALYRKWLASAGQPAAARAGDSGAAWLVLLTLAIVLLAIEPQIRERSVAALLVVVLLLRPGKAGAQTVEEWFGRGMDAMNAHKYSEAMGYFGNAATWAPDIPEIRFNLATALYDFHSYAEAALSFDHAARLAGDQHLKALSRLGQGNALFRDATDGDTRTAYAIPRLRAAIEAYRAALQLEPDLFNAEVNLKVAERRLSRMQQKELPPAPRMPGSEGHQASSNPDEILGKAGRPPVPRGLSKPAAVDRDW
jgi:tetratricopeptide (TPR) repeat protein